MYPLIQQRPRGFSRALRALGMTGGRDSSTSLGMTEKQGLKDQGDVSTLRYAAAQHDVFENACLFPTVRPTTETK